VSFYDNEVDDRTEPPVTSAVGVAEITHEVIRDQLSDFQDNGLDERERERVDHHLLHCAACRAYARTLRATADALGKLPAVPAPEQSKQRLRQIALG
jgi:anti-sigma factor RsiW